MHIMGGQCNQEEVAQEFPDQSVISIAARYR